MAYYIILIAFDHLSLFTTFLSKKINSVLIVFCILQAHERMHV